MDNIEYYRDRDEVKSLPSGLVSLIQRRGLIAPDQTRIHYCGLISWQQGIAVFMPRNTCLDSLSPHHAFYLLQSLSRYYLGKNTGIQEGQENDLIGKESLSLINFLIDDYRAHGLYVRRKKHVSINNGHQNWQRTIVQRIPYPSGDSLVYLDIDTNSTRYVSECEVARIHAQVIRSIYKKYGVIITGDFTHTDDSLERMPVPKSGTETQITSLDNELSKSYSNRNIQLFVMLKAYIEEASAIEGNELLIGTRKFHNVWEGMLDKCLPNKVEINSNLPVPYYQQNNYFIEVSQKGQRTDTVIESEDRKHWAVIDAKYYNASTPNLAPGWHDLVKQFFYKIAVENVCESDIEVSLHFIFPGHTPYLNKIEIGKRNQKRIDLDNFLKVNGYGEIFCHYCDPVILLERYARGQLLELDCKSHITGDFFNK